MPELTGEQKLMGVLSYLGILVLVPWLTKKDDPFVKSHVKQGLMLLIVSAVVWFVGMFLFWVPMMWFLTSVLWFAVFIIAIMGIVKAAQGQTWEIPVLGKTAASWNL